MKILNFLWVILIAQNLFANTDKAAVAYQVPLTTASNSLQKIVLPVSILSKVKQIDYTDIAVFNQQNQALEQIIEIENEQQTKIQKGKKEQMEQALPFYVLNKNSRANDSKETQIEFWKQQKQTETRRIQTDIYQDHRLQYIVKLPKNDYFLKKLILQWNSFKQNKMIPLKIESSNDLTTWRVIKYRVVVAELRLNQQMILQNKINLPSPKARYLRLSELETRGEFKLSSVIGQYTKQHQIQLKPPPKQWRSVKDVLLGSANAILFDTGGTIPLSEMQFKIPKENRYYHGQLYSRANKKQAWNYHRKIEQYHLQIDSEWISSEPIKLLSTARDRYWKIIFKQPQPISADQIPLIELTEKKVSLFFFAQGKKPYILSIMQKPMAEKESIPIIQALFSQKNKEKAESVFLKTAISEIPQTIANQFSWKTIILWLVLCLGTIVMASMAFKLYREMEQS